MKKSISVEPYLDKELLDSGHLLFSNNLQVSLILEEFAIIPRYSDIPKYNTTKFVLYNYHKPISKCIDQNLLINEKKHE